MPTRQLEGFHTVKAATVALGLATSDEDDKRGQRWLRDGVNRKVNPFPHHRMSGLLVFSDSDLAEIAEMHHNAPTRRAARPRRRAQQTALAAA